MGERAAAMPLRTLTSRNFRREEEGGLFPVLFVCTGFQLSKEIQVFLDRNSKFTPGSSTAR
jgi:hypothetical protein